MERKKISEIVFNYSDIEIVDSYSKIVIPDEVNLAIENYWNDQIAKGKSYTNGELFSVRDIEIRDDRRIQLNMTTSNFAHYLYSMANKNSCIPKCISVATNGLLETTDGYYILGLMSAKTSHPKKVKFIGGSISKDDIVDNQFDLKGGLVRELNEEIGFASDHIKGDYVNNIVPILILTREKLSFYNILHHVKIQMEKDEFHKKFMEFNEHQKVLGLNELEDVLYIKNQKVELERFVSEKKYEAVTYLYETFKVLSGEMLAGDIKTAIKEEALI